MWCARGRCAGDGRSRGGGQVATWDIIMVLMMLMMMMMVLVALMMLLMMLMIYIFDDDDGVGGHDDVVGDDKQDRLPTKFHMSFIKMTIKMLKESKI